MKDFLVDQFLEKIKKNEKQHSEKDLLSLKEKAKELIDALCSKRLILHDSGTYAITFIVGPGPVYFHTFFQVKSALELLLAFIKKDDFYLDLPERGSIEMVNYIIDIKAEIINSLQLFAHFFKQDYDEQERIEFSIKNIRKLYSLENTQKMFEIHCDTIDDEISFLSGLLRDLKTDQNLYLFFGTEKIIFEERVNTLLVEKSAERALQKIQSQVEERFADVNSHLDIFKPNGFRLFDYLMKNHLSSGKGWQSDIAFFYRMMEERDGLIHAGQKRFRTFLENHYSHLEPMGKFKVWNDVDNEKRRNIYSAAKKAIGLK
ncbi:MAG: hypothetical protein HWE07_05000 [Cytophagia bacterium]|nr:hypothetical protein [Cytophagia bacterium]